MTKANDANDNLPATRGDVLAAVCLERSVFRR